MEQASVFPEAANKAAATQQKVTAFVCANCARPGVMPLSVHQRPDKPEFGWPFAVEEILIPCSGRLQPEHLLKAFESGSSLVCIIACQDDNCHYVEGCRRMRKRLEYVRDLLEQIGLGGDRLLMFELPGSAQEDLLAGECRPQASQVTPEELARRIQAIRDEVTAKFKVLPPNPLHNPPAKDEPAEGTTVEETDGNED